MFVILEMFFDLAVPVCTVYLLVRVHFLKKEIDALKKSSQ